MTKLTKLLKFATGLKHRGKDVEVSLKPTKEGGAIVFKVGMKRKTVPLAQILTNVVESKAPNVCSADWVDLAQLESLVAIYVLGDGETEVERKAALKAKSGLWNMVRDLRDNRRIAKGIEPISWNPKKVGTAERIDKEDLKGLKNE